MDTLRFYFGRMRYFITFNLVLIVFSATLISCASHDSGWGELEETVPPSGCTILRKQIEEENKKNGTNKVAQC